MLVTKANKTVTNISKLSPTHSVSNIRHHHRWSRIFHSSKSNSWILLKDAILKKELRKNDVLFDPKKYGIKEESTNLDYRRKFSFSAFVNSIANSTLGRERLHDHHWMSQFYHCRVRIVEISSRMNINPYWQFLEKSSRNFLKFQFSGSWTRPYHWKIPPNIYISFPLNALFWIIFSL